MPGNIRFGVYELDRDAMELRKLGVPIRLQDQPFRLLLMLAERPGQIVTREELQARIWDNTFVDFDQSLNKAVNRVREALNDNAGAPQYVETVPRRGYRFIAPVVTVPIAESPDPPRPADPATVEPAAQTSPSRPPYRIVAIAGLVFTALLAVVVLAAFVRSRQEKNPTLQDSRLITSSGWQPALSRDGKLLAYVSSIGDEPTHIWVQQTAGGQALPVTTGSNFDALPDFSPDGTRIAFYSTKKGGGIYTKPTLAGDPKLLVGIPKAIFPRFSPSGESILYLQGRQAFTVPADGGEPAPLPLNQDFIVYGPPLWSPDGKKILFYGNRRSEPDKPSQWWMVPLIPGPASALQLPGTEQSPRSFTVHAWLRTADQQEWILYSISKPHSWKLCRVKISARGETDETAEIIAAGNGSLGSVGSESGDGKLAYTIVSATASIYQISINDKGQKTAPTLQLPTREAGFQNSPSISHDGTWMAYISDSPGETGLVMLKNLTTGAAHLLDDSDKYPGGDVVGTISPDASRVIFQRSCKESLFRDQPDRPLPCSFIVSAAGGDAERICLRCTPSGFSSDGSSVLLQKYDQSDANKDRIVLMDLRTKIERDFRSDPGSPLYHPAFSWNDHWVVFKKVPSWGLPDPPSQILVAPVRGGSAAPEAQWIPVTDGLHSDDKPQFSADGNTVYFTSTRDGYLCIWAQKLDPNTKHPVGPPLPLEHFHNSPGHDASLNQRGSDLSVARDKILINLPDLHSALWMTQTP